MALQNLLLPGAELLFAPAFLPAAEATVLLAHLTAAAAWEQRTIRLFGQEFPQPRLTAWYGDPEARYTYSNLTWEPLPWLPALADLRQRLETATHARYNSVLLNLYRDGLDSMGWHADDEPELG
ncbi:alpha-ketoglutarate-dependent dioxygenase AlkB family protein, partial [Hymenobacter agri]